MALRTLLSAMAINVACFQPTNFDVRHCVGVAAALGTFVRSAQALMSFDRSEHALISCAAVFAASRLLEKARVKAVAGAKALAAAA
eukprot:6203101-Prymnesium_polylepis.1